MALATRIAAPDCDDPLERCRQIEAEPLPASVWRLLDDATRDASDQLLWDFFQAQSRATYAEVHETAAALAAGLYQRGVRQRSVVAIMLPNVPEYPLAWLALARLGAVAVPVNPQYTPREIRYVLADSAASCVIVHDVGASAVDSVIASLPDISPDRVFVVGKQAQGHEPFKDLLHAHGADTSNFNEPQLDDLLSIQYTSGTTGLPKGCLLTHRQWLTCGKVNARRDGRSYRRILASTPFFYMDPHWLLLMTLFQRATLYVAERQSASHFMQW
ncbi:MAG: class I adenylate-forming enzyme family protein, partial [Burkholderiaceae bacterium]